MSDFSPDEFERGQGPRYAKELDDLADFIQSRHWAGRVKGIGRLEAVEATKQYVRKLEKS